ncbi:monovalent cation/H+ antiporter subunit C [Paenibacillus sp. FSL R7-0273]|uniref:Na(+)/H(+) antiporter subunit C n=1 Tax=Paenibacillus sp. FSL R7-0273 TaxID=1536772 RepID=UPI0004F5DAD6|nr:Na(+)/H(+) antiporter subunit C [Paenibacillus sp. FSL R7-0273]AIQ46565.1 monovalent cation/H+ antiporter subunit C [Paenibacillus sp. FSL R7-0273]OMF97667.1 Na(+)/H(+) antiporter subunit C [Paenibacillus sp. FSL R7-0273]
MELLMAVAVGILFTIGIYLILSKSLLRIVLGTSLLTHGVHLLLLTMAGLKRGAAPVLGGTADTYVDPLPQALILTSIVISFGVTAFFFVLAYRSYQTLGTDEIDSIKEEKE